MPSPSPRFALRSRRVCLPDGVAAATLLINGERIEAVVPDDSGQWPNSLDDVPCEDLGDLVISPGLIDAHVHVNEPGRTDWEGFESATKAAVAGGVSLIVDMPLNSHPVTTSVRALAVKRAAARGKCWCDVGFYGGLVPGNADEIEPLIEAGVLGIKAFLCDSGLDEFLPATESDLRVALRILHKHGVPLLAHAELVDDVSPAAYSDERSYAEYAASRPDRWELSAIQMLIRLCAACPAPVHIVHLSSAAALPLIREAKERGLPLTVETCPHYLFFSAEEVSDGDTRFKCAPPIRSGANRAELLTAVANTSPHASSFNGSLIDTIGSDHSPCPPALKRLSDGSFMRAWGGIASLQLTLPVVWSCLRPSGVALSRLAELLSHRPAQLLGLHDRKGSLRPGLDADLCIWDPNEEWTVRPENLHMRHPLTPYEGRTLAGAVKRTYARGELASPERAPCGVAVLRTGIVR
jgi:allantoinase